MEKTFFELPDGAIFKFKNNGLLCIKAWDQTVDEKLAINLKDGTIENEYWDDTPVEQLNIDFKKIAGE